MRSRPYVYHNRLLKLADFLDQLPRSRFNYNHWVGDDWEGASDLSCGTTACALGWATAMKPFRRLGLRMDKESTPYIKDRVRLDLYGAITYLFGPDSEAVFFPESYDRVQDEYAPPYGATPKQVARFIRAHVKAAKKVLAA